MNHKKVKHEPRIVEVENASFISLIFACTGGAGPTATKVMKLCYKTMRAEERKLR